MYYADEVRDFRQVPKGDDVKVSEKELDLGVGLIDRLTSEEFHRENYRDEYRIRVLGMLDEKSKGKEIVIDTAPAAKRGQVINIMEALKRSMERVPARKKPATASAVNKKTESCKRSSKMSVSRSPFYPLVCQFQSTEPD
jgi:DNA end-binding protein Ku